MPVMNEVKREAKRQGIKLLILPAIAELKEHPDRANADLHVTCLGGALSRPVDIKRTGIVMTPGEGEKGLRGELGFGFRTLRTGLAYGWHHSLRAVSKTAERRLSSLTTVSAEALAIRRSR